MNYDALTVVYRQRQVDRLSRALQRLGEIETAPGRVVPEAEDLVIGAGRRLGVTIMFVDISGFSSWPAETLAEQKGVLAVLMGIEFVSLTEGVDTSTPTGRMIFTVLGAVAELERSLIAERVRAGLRNAKAKGKKLGKAPPGCGPLSDSPSTRSRVPHTRDCRQAWGSPLALFIKPWEIVNAHPLKSRHLEVPPQRSFNICFS